MDSPTPPRHAAMVSSASNMETARTLAHVSDLHYGRDAATERACERIRDALVQARVDDVLVTGDVTDRGRA